MPRGEAIFAQTDGHTPPLRPVTVRDMIADKLAALIASGALEEGDELPSERELSAALSVSRESVRAAIGALSACGILTVAQGARTRVGRVDFANMPVGITNRLNVDAYALESVHAARLLIEQFVVGEAALRITTATLARLERSLAAQEDACADPVRFLISDREFHVAVYRECGNPLLADIVTDLYTYLMDHRRRAVARAGAIALSIGDHRRIVAGLRAQDPEATRAAFRDHETRIFETTRALMQARAGRAQLQPSAPPDEGARAPRED